MTNAAESGIGQTQCAIPPSSKVARPLGVLVVDDEEAIRHLLALGMRSHGFAIWLAASGLAAVDLYRRYRDAIDVVLLDVRMPVRDGPETLAALRELDPHVCCSFMSGDTGKYTEENLIALGASAVFTKPLRLSDLAQKLMAIALRPTGCQETFEESRWEDDGGFGKVLAQNLSDSEKKLQPKTELQEA